MGKTLVSWLGAADLLRMGMQLPEAEKKTLLKDINRQEPPSEPKGRGPVRTLVEEVNFDAIHLLNNYTSVSGKKYVSWLGQKVKLHNVKLKDPSNYEQVYEVADKALENITAGLGDNELCIHLTPGTPTMIAIWVLLGKSRYPADFYQTYKDKVNNEEIPFDLVMDFIPEVLGEKGNALQHLYKDSPPDLAKFKDIIGESQPMVFAKAQAIRFTLTGEYNVLITGESGTGKELFARAIHNHSRPGEKFVAINCAAISPNLIESELFGHVKGAFTDAQRDKDGAFLKANGGTLFLDEIGECDPSMQAKLLRVLQPGHSDEICDRAFYPVGAPEQELHSNVRLIAATNQDLVRDVKEKHFRDDLFYRLADGFLELPPLRKRKQDIPHLIDHLLGKINEETRREKKIAHTAISLAQREDWPGNVRQLNSALRRAVILGDGDTISRSDLKAAIIHVPVETGILDRPLDDSFDLQAVLDEVSIHYIERAKEKHNHNKSEVAESLGFNSGTTLANWLTKLDIKW